MIILIFRGNAHHLSVSKCKVQVAPMIITLFQNDGNDVSALGKYSETNISTPPQYFHSSNIVKSRPPAKPVACFDPIRVFYRHWSLKTHRFGSPIATSFSYLSPKGLFLSVLLYWLTRERVYILWC